MENIRIEKETLQMGFEGMLKQEPKEADYNNWLKYPTDVETQLRFSDDELKEFKELILYKLENAQLDYDQLKNTLALRDDNGTNDTSRSFKMMEDAGDVLSKEETAQLAGRQEKLIHHLRNALVRIKNKTYGVCVVTGKLIPKERLRSVPHTTMSMNAKQSLSNSIS